MGFRKNPGLFFRLTVEGFTDEHYGDFAEVSGINIRSEQDQTNLPVTKLFKQFVPSPPKHPILTFKKGVLKGLILIEWLQPRYESLVFTSKNLNLNLIDERGTIYSSWHIVNAYPVSINLAFSETNENVLIIEALELSYNSFIKKR